LTVTHRRYVPYSHAHYGGNLVEGAYALGLFGDVATELAIRTDGDESLLAGYDSIEMLAPLQAGDIVEASATLTRVGRRSRAIAFEARVVCRSAPDGPRSGADRHTTLASNAMARLRRPNLVRVALASTMSPA